MKIEVDVIGKSCPHPLIHMRKAIMKASEGDTVIIKVDHEQSRDEIPWGAASMGCKVEKDTIDDAGIWTIIIAVTK